MSEVFEGVLFPVEPGVNAELSSALRTSFESSVLEPGLCAAYRSDSRREGTFVPSVDKLAADVSLQYGRSLVVRFDSRVGHRSAILFVNGERAAVFGERDELYVPLDERGFPRRDGERLRADQLAPDEEYETIENAIQLGLKALGRGKWADLFRLMTTR